MLEMYWALVVPVVFIHVIAFAPLERSFVTFLIIVHSSFLEKQYFKLCQLSFLEEEYQCNLN